MLKLSLIYGWLLLVRLLARNASATKLINIELSTTEVLYLNERLQHQEHMNDEDALNTIIELEHFYTLIKNTVNGTFAPSTMVDKAWHQHILHTKMYNMFSRQQFGVEVLHHVPFWSGNKEEMMHASAVAEELGPEVTYGRLVLLLGPRNVNATIWLTDEEEPNEISPNTQWCDESYLTEKVGITAHVHT